MSFVHLHNHTTYSFLDGFNSPQEAAKRSKELGMSHLAITDHNTLAGVIDFQEACYESEVVPIIGLEGYYTWDTSILSESNTTERNKRAIIEAKEQGNHILDTKKKKKKKNKEEYIEETTIYDTTQYHMILLANGQEGWKNLVKLQSEAARACTFNKRFLFDDNILERYSDNLIMTTACIANAAASLFIKGDRMAAENQLNKWLDIFGDNFYIEIQPLDIQKQWVANYYLINWARKNNVKIIATNDVHYTYRQDHYDHDTLLCVQIDNKKDNPNRMQYSNDFWLRSIEEMEEAFWIQSKNIADGFNITREEYMNIAKEAMNETQTLADSIDTNIKLKADEPQFPLIEIQSSFSNEEELTYRCYRKLYKYKNNNSEINLAQYEKRLREELNIINKKGFASYMLIVEEYTNWCKRKRIPVGPGRGSCAGSLTLFLLGITMGVDPIKYGLIFERFLTEDRTSPPDVDQDFCYFRRPEVIKHLQDKYGVEKVSNIGTITTLGVKSALKDTARALGLSYKEADKLTKDIERILSEIDGTSFKNLDDLSAFDNEVDQSRYKRLAELEEQYPEIFRSARRFEGTPRNMGVHASGILVTPTPVNDHIPTREVKGRAISIYSGEQLEDLNYLKFDILGLKTLSVIQMTLKSIDKNLYIDDLYNIIDINDPKIFKLINQKKTDGLFQIESNMFKGMIGEIQPDCFEDLIAITSLGRPGPLQAEMDKSYARRKHKKETSIEPLYNTWDIVEETFGTIVYQEQVMKIAQRVAGFDSNQADTYLRKALGKKIKEKMNLCRQWFIFGKINEKPPKDYNPDNKDQPMYDPDNKYGESILGGINNGYKLQTLIDFWNRLEGYANYLFNKSHAASYSYVTMMTGYLKTYYPVEFMAALLSIQETDEDITRYVRVAEEMGIKVLHPDINKSQEGFSKEGKKSIRMGLGCIKGVGKSSLPDIIRQRPYRNIEEAVSRLPRKKFSKTVAVNMIKAGCFDFQDDNRSRLINRLYDIRNDRDEERLREEFYTNRKLIEYEKETIRVPVTEKPWWDKVAKKEEIEEDMFPTRVTEIKDKKGRPMAFIEGTIKNCEIKGVIFAQYYGPIRDIIQKEVIQVRGYKDDNDSLIVTKAKAAEKNSFLKKVLTAS